MVVVDLLFHNMAARPWPWLLFIPAVYIVLIVLAFYSHESYVEGPMRNLWMPTIEGGDYEANQVYLKDIASVSIFSAIAVARDGGNLLTESRLDEITARMQTTEAATVRGCIRASYKV
jgi:hypothetical protein